MMEFHDFGDPPLEAEPSLGWYLQELVQAGTTSTTRHTFGCMQPASPVETGASTSTTASRAPSNTRARSTKST